LAATIWTIEMLGISKLIPRDSHSRVAFSFWATDEYIHGDLILFI